MFYFLKCNYDIVVGYEDRAPKSETQYNIFTLDLALIIDFCIDIELSIQTHITYIVHDLGG